MKALVGAFNKEKALVGAFSVILQLHRLTDLRHYLIPRLRPGCGCWQRVGAVFSLGQTRSALFTAVSTKHRSRLFLLTPHSSPLRSQITILNFHPSIIWPSLARTAGPASSTVVPGGTFGAGIAGTSCTAGVDRPSTLILSECSFPLEYNAQRGSMYELMSKLRKFNK